MELEANTRTYLQSITSKPTRPEANMGNKDSKDTTQNGDHDVTIIQIQEVHISILADHDAKLTDEEGHGHGHHGRNTTPCNDTDDHQETTEEKQAAKAARAAAIIPV